MFIESSLRVELAEAVDKAVISGKDITKSELKCLIFAKIKTPNDPYMSPRKVILLNKVSYFIEELIRKDLICYTPRQPLVFSKELRENLSVISKQKRGDKHEMFLPQV